MIKEVIGLYFSPSGETAKITKKITSEIAGRIQENSAWDIEVSFIDLLTDPPEEDLVLSDEVIAVFGMPVYSGRIPLPCVKMLRRLHGSDTLTIATVTYGNSSYGDSLYELYSFTEDQGFSVISAGAFIAQHAIFEKIAESRPDLDDLHKIIEFSALSAKKLKHFMGSSIRELRARPAPLSVKGSMPNKGPIRIPLHPAVNRFCINCGECAKICPVGAIDPADPSKINHQTCISCAACVRVCKQDARGFFGPMCAASRIAFEKLYSKRKDPEWFL